MYTKIRIFEENFLKQSFKKFSSKIARKDEWRKLAKTTTEDCKDRLAETQKYKQNLRLREGVERSGTTVAIQYVLHLVNRHIILLKARKDKSKFFLKLFILFSRSFVVLLFVFFFIVLIFYYVRHNFV